MSTVILENKYTKELKYVRIQDFVKSQIGEQFYDCGKMEELEKQVENLTDVVSKLVDFICSSPMLYISSYDLKNILAVPNIFSTSRHDENVIGIEKL